MQIKYGFILVFLFFCSAISAQEDPRFTLFPWVQPFYNAGAMGEKEYHINFTVFVFNSSKHSCFALNMEHVVIQGCKK